MMLIAESMSAQLERHLAGEEETRRKRKRRLVRVSARDRALTPNAGMTAVTDPGSCWQGLRGAAGEDFLAGG